MDIFINYSNISSEVPDNEYKNISVTEIDVDILK